MRANYKSYLLNQESKDILHSSIHMFIQWPPCSFTVEIGLQIDCGNPNVINIHDIAQNDKLFLLRIC
jgi:hypothetical protein